VPAATTGNEVARITAQAAANGHRRVSEAILEDMVTLPSRGLHTSAGAQYPLDRAAAIQ
jgi:hypothetical protein